MVLANGRAEQAANQVHAHADPVAAEVPVRLRVKVGGRDEDDLCRLRDEPRDDPVARAALDELGDLEVGGDLEAGRVDEDKVGAFGDGAARRGQVRIQCLALGNADKHDTLRQPELVEPLEQDRPPLLVRLDLVLEEAVLERLLEPDGDGFLRRAVAAENDARLRGEERVDQVGGADGPADAPAGHRERLALR